MVNYRLLGSATTNSQGVATYTYTGVGAGEMNIIASTDNPITDSSLLSEIYGLIDAVFVDNGVTGDYNSNWTSPVSRISRTVTDTGSVLAMASGITWGYWYVVNESTYYTTDFTIEFDITNYVSTSSYNPRIRVRNSSNSSATTQLNQNGHYKIQAYADKIVCQVDNGTPWEVSIDLTNGGAINFELPANENTITYKNFKIYSI